MYVESKQNNVRMYAEEQTEQQAATTRINSNNKAQENSKKKGRSQVLICSRESNSLMNHSEGCGNRGFDFRSLNAHFLLRLSIDGRLAQYLQMYHPGCQPGGRRTCFLCLIYILEFMVVHTTPVPAERVLYNAIKILTYSDTYNEYYQ